MFDIHENLLDCDGEAFYFEKVFGIEECLNYFERLKNEIEWRNDEVKIFGKLHITARKVAWYADEGLNYTYSGITKANLAWTNTLLEIKSKVENACGYEFNACLLNLYHNGEEGMGWHSDDEPELGDHAVIASISFGAERKFAFKHKSKPLQSSIVLKNGSMLLMKSVTQQYWKHSLLKSKRIKTPRINLTFRRILR